MLSFEIFVKSMPPRLSELKVTPSFCFAFKIPDDVTPTNTYRRYALRDIMTIQVPLIYIFFDFRPLCVDLDNTMAINGNVCLCETNEEGSGRLCRRCGLERQASKAKVESWWRDWINSSFDHQSSAHNVRILGNLFHII